jgi:hypothetical protein
MNVRNVIRPLVTRQGSSAMAYYRRTVSFDAHASQPVAAAAAAAAEPAVVADVDPPPAERDALDRLFLGDA